MAIFAQRATSTSYPLSVGIPFLYTCSMVMSLDKTKPIHGFTVHRTLQYSQFNPSRGGGVGNSCRVGMVKSRLLSKRITLSEGPHTNEFEVRNKELSWRTINLRILRIYWGYSKIISIWTVNEKKSLVTLLDYADNRRIGRISFRQDVGMVQMHWYLDERVNRDLLHHRVC